MTCLIFESATLKFQSAHIIVDIYTTAMSSTLSDTEAFLDSFNDAGGWYDSEVFGLVEFDQMGWGGVALKDIEVSPPPIHRLFPQCGT